jgi:hypothetical protein
MRKDLDRQRERLLDSLGIEDVVRRTLGDGFPLPEQQELIGVANGKVEVMEDDSDPYALTCELSREREGAVLVA